MFQTLISVHEHGNRGEPSSCTNLLNMSSVICDKVRGFFWILLTRTRHIVIAEDISSRKETLSQLYTTYPILLSAYIINK